MGHAMREKVERGCRDPNTLCFVTESGSYDSTQECSLLIDAEVMSESAVHMSALALAVGTRRVDRCLYAIVPPGFDLQECIFVALSCYGYSYNPDTMLGVTDQLCCEIWRLIELVPSMCDPQLKSWMQRRAGGRSKMGYCETRAVSRLNSTSVTRAAVRFPGL